ncbi:hypothetical protein LTR84_001530 [Exophiala bonariae]|uniref:Uncharacterized protein n=1 Tax=Exophiala bonariae TaxID=1690606 RepID=A0AAV9NCZ0_9EURO|nr:hypothetical protein LTR84_001530 [Exophiala bonariae]
MENVRVFRNLVSFLRYPAALSASSVIILHYVAPQLGFQLGQLLNHADERGRRILSSLVQQLADHNTAAAVYQPEFRRAVLAAVQRYFERGSQGQRPTAWLNTLIQRLDLHNRIDFRGGLDLLFNGLLAWTMFQYLPEQDYLVRRNMPVDPAGGEVRDMQRSPPEGRSMYPDPERLGQPQQPRREQNTRIRPFLLYPRILLITALKDPRTQSGKVKLFTPLPFLSIVFVIWSSTQAQSLLSSSPTE